MIIRNGTTIWSLIRDHWRALAVVLLISFSVELLADTGVFDLQAFSLSSISVLTTALTIYLVFRVNEAYERWWEARKLWGALVNDSRRFARQVLSMVTAERVSGIADTDGEKRLQTQFIHRQIAYVHALRTHLRGQGDWSDAARLLGEDETQALEEAANRPAQLVLLQATCLRSVLGPNAAEQLILNQIDDTLSKFYDIQGGCERIKNTAFPDAITLFTQQLVWLVAVLIPIAIIDPDNQFDLLELGVVTLMSYSIVMINELGQDLKNPFENSPNDTPMTSLCATIEIDLRQMLGETELPEPVKPEKGILM